MKTTMFIAFLVSMFFGMLNAQDYVPPQSRVFIEEGETADVSGKIEDRESRGDFGMAIVAALQKKKVPLAVVTDPTKADYIIRHSSTRDEDGTGTKIAKLAFGGGLWGGGVKFEGTFMVIDQESTVVVFSYNVKKNNFQSAAESFAKNLKKHIEKGIKESKNKK